MTQSVPSVRLRFAPSPTGFLHIGGVRTALFNWLFAKRHGGQFLLRIEDTDLERSEEKYTQDILASLKWLGLHWDEEPLHQSKRLDIYRSKAEELLVEGKAYRCYCSESDVEKMREKATREGKKPQYDRTCRDKNLPQPDSGQPYVIRAKIPLEGHVEFQDLIRGPIRFENSEIDDFVLVRSNGAPIYNLSVVVDDVLSRVTHVLRGDDHINNTPKQYHLYRFMNYPVPLFAHLPMILGADKKKLSKRHGAVSANVYRADGFLPEALLNFLARLGWSHGDQEIFTLDEMIQYFSFDHVQKSSAVFNSEKLQWLNGMHIRQADSQRLLDIVLEDYADLFQKEGLKRAHSPLGLELVKLIQPKVKSVRDLADQLAPLCIPGTVPVDLSGLKWNKDPNLKAPLQAAIKHAVEAFSNHGKVSEKTAPQGESWGSHPALGDYGIKTEEIEQTLRQICDQHGVKLGDLAQPMRLAVTGRMISAGLFDLMAILPWDLVESRLKQALEWE